jgi:dCTP diphosphatase
MSTIQLLTSQILRFRDARHWKDFHGPKEMALALSVEASELLQHFVWLDVAQAEERVQQKKEEIASEMADVGILLFEMADNCGIDLSQAILKKLAHNEQRYPVEKSKGSNKKYNEL